MPKSYVLPALQGFFGNLQVLREFLMGAAAFDISVALASYNGEKYLREQIESILAQTIKVDEIVIVDDCSSDHTAEIALDLSARFDVVKLYRNEKNLGYRENFMKACQLARGNVIFFCDQDDVWATDKVERVMERFRDPDILLVYHNAVVTNEVLNQIGNLDRHALGKDSGRFSDFKSVWFSSLGFTQAIRRDLLRFDQFWPQSLDHNKQREVLAHDQWYFFLAGLFGKVSYIDAPLASYRQHGANVDGWGGRRKFFDRLRPKTKNAAENFAEASESRLYIISLLSDFAGANSELEAATERFEKAAKLYRRRTNLYRRINFFGRLYWFLRCVQSGYVRSLGRDEGRKSLMQDLFFGIYRRSQG